MIKDHAYSIDTTAATQNTCKCGAKESEHAAWHTPTTMAQVVKTIEALCVTRTRSDNAQVRAIAQFPHPSDAFLYRVMVERAADDFIVWTFNAQDKGLHNGTYHNNCHAAYRNFIDGLPA